MAKTKTPTEIASLARAYTDTALKMLAGVISREDAPLAPRVAAANALLDRGWGKPRQAAAEVEAPEVRTEILEVIRTIVDPAARLREQAAKPQIENTSSTLPPIEGPAANEADEPRHRPPGHGDGEHDQ